MTAKTIFQFNTGTITQWESSPSTSLPIGIWEPGFALTPLEFEPDLTGGVGLTTLEPEYEIEVGGLICIPRGGRYFTPSAFCKPRSCPKGALGQPR